MFGSSKKTDDRIEEKYKRAMEESVSLRNNVASLNDEIKSLFTTIKEKDEIIRSKDKIIEQQKEIIRKKDEKILFLEETVQSGVIMIDSHTKLYNLVYFEKMLQPILNTDYYVLTIEFIDYEPKFDEYYKQDIACIIRKFTSNSDMTPVLWKDNIIKLFVLVTNEKIDKLKDEVTNLLKGYASKKEISLSFKQYNKKDYE